MIYNLWSVLSFAASKVKKFRPFRVNTTGTEMIDKLVTREGKVLREELGRLLEGKTIKKPVHDSIIMNDLAKRTNLVWSFLLFSGYLKHVGEAESGRTRELEVPNKEVQWVFEDLIQRWLEKKVEPDRQEDMIEALEAGDVERFERELRVAVIQVMSYHDFSGAPEKVYQALMIGLRVWCSDKYEIRSNRESGLGRYDLALKPGDITKQAVVMEFKRVGETGEGAPEKTLTEALEQIRARRYETEMITAGVTDVLKKAVAFRGNEFWVRSTGVC